MTNLQEEKPHMKIKKPIIASTNHFTKKILNIFCQESQSELTYDLNGIDQQNGILSMINGKYSKLLYQCEYMMVKVVK